MKLFGPETTVLIVEDDAVIAIDTDRALSQVGCTVYHAFNAEDALKLLAKTKSIAVLITDINLPGEMNGARLADHVRGKHPDIKVIFISAGLLPNLEAGDIFIRKPYWPAELLDVMRG